MLLFVNEDKDGKVNTKELGPMLRSLGYGSIVFFACIGINLYGIVG